MYQTQPEDRHGSKAPVALGRQPSQLLEGVQLQPERRPGTYVLGDRALAALASAPADSDARAVPAGPRFRAKFEADVQRLLGRVRGPQAP